MNRMTKSQIIEELATKLGIPKTKATLVVNTILDSMIEALEDERRIEIRGFGSIRIKHYDSYTGRNPSTGEKVKVPPKKLPVFKVGKMLRDMLNERVRKSRK